MIVMINDKMDSTNLLEFKTIIQLMKTTELIKDNSKQYQNQNNSGEIYHE